MSPLAEIGLVTSRELRRTFHAAKGVLLAALSAAGGAGVSMIAVKSERFRREVLPPGVDARALQEQVFQRWYGPDTGKALAACPYALWIVFVATIWLCPLLVALLDFDAVSGEVQHRTVRFWTVRCRRGSYFVGKSLGAWLAVLAVTLGMNAVVWAVIAGTGGAPAAQVIGWGARFFLVSVPISAAWCGLAMLVGSQGRTPMLSLFGIFAVFFGLWVVRVAAGGAWPAYAYPNIYDGLLLSPRPADVAAGLLGAGGIAALTTTAGALLFARRDV